jgi:hypothetical protein
MIEEEISSEALDFGYLREAIEGRNPDLLLGFYADDAALRIVNSDAPGGPAFELRGTAQIEKCLRAVCDQEMTCAVEGMEVKRGHISFGETCEYPDRTRVLVRTTLELRGGRISRQLDVVGRVHRDEG